MHISIHISAMLMDTEWFNRCDNLEVLEFTNPKLFWLIHLNKGTTKELQLIKDLLHNKMYLG